MLFGSDGSPAHLGSPADIDGVGSPGRPDRGGEAQGAQTGKAQELKKDVDSTTGNYGLRQCAPKNSFLPKTFPF